MALQVTTGIPIAKFHTYEKRNPEPLPHSSMNVTRPPRLRGAILVNSPENLPRSDPNPLEATIPKSVSAPLSDTSTTSVPHNVGENLCQTNDAEHEVVCHVAVETFVGDACNDSIGEHNGDIDELSQSNEEWVDDWYDSDCSDYTPKVSNGINRRRRPQKSGSPVASNGDCRHPNMDGNYFPVHKRYEIHNECLEEPEPAEAGVKRSHNHITRVSNPRGESTMRKRWNGEAQ